MKNKKKKGAEALYELKDEYDRNMFTFYESISKKLNDAIKTSGFSQRAISARCKLDGFEVSQGAISKILDYGLEEGAKRPPSISLIHLTYICKVLQMDLVDILPQNTSMMQQQITQSPIELAKMRESQTLVVDPKRKEFKGYLGTFHCRFYSTISTEHMLLKAKLTFSENVLRNSCDAVLEIQVGQSDNESNYSIKRYSGSLIISVPQNSCYCILTNNEYGEICMLNFHHRYFFTDHKLQCRLACAITTSAGESRRPTMHRMLITKNELKPETYERIKSQLLLNNRDIIVQEDKLKRLMPDMEEEIEYSENKEMNDNDEILSKEIAELFGESGIIRPKPYYVFTESQIQDVLIEPAKRAKAICTLRKYSVSQRYNKIGSKADELIYKYLKSTGEVL